MFSNLPMLAILRGVRKQKAFDKDSEIACHVVEGQEGKEIRSSRRCRRTSDGGTRRRQHRWRPTKASDYAAKISVHQNPRHRMRGS